MIIVKINGGLGNQMFQYAFGRSQSLLLNTQLKLDISWFTKIPETDTVRTYELDCFNLKQVVALESEIQKTKGIFALLPKRIIKLFNKMNFLHQNSYFLEKKYNYDNTIVLSTGDTYFEGYWQSYHYFEKYKDIIKDEFIENYILINENNKITEIIESQNAVSLHIRRGDYISNPNANSYHGICSLEYYEKSMQYIATEISNPYFIIFSDDIEWVKKNLQTTFSLIFVERKKDDKPFDDIYLMSKCQHNIIANSSFSWWGAYLNSNSQKIVIAPKKWFNDSSKDTTDLIPVEWIRL